MLGYCMLKNIPCEFVNDYGFCSISACAKNGFSSKTIVYGDHIIGDTTIYAKWDDNHCCTNCKNEALLEYECDGCDEGFAWKHSPYCPYCGAIMDEDMYNNKQNLINRKDF